MLDRRWYVLHSILEHIRLRHSYVLQIAISFYNQIINDNDIFPAAMFFCFVFSFLVTLGKLEYLLCTEGFKETDIKKRIGCFVTCLYCPKYHKMITVQLSTLKQNQGTKYPNQVAG